MPAADQATVDAKAQLAAGGRFTALMYDYVLALGERAGMAQLRRDVIAGVSGSVLEIGAGTGLNVPDYPNDLDRLVLTEPEKFMAQKLARRVEDAGVDAEVVVAPAEALPFDDASFDSVVATMVLCTVADQAASLSEIERVLKPGGHFHFVEHVRSEEPGLAKWQDRLHGPWRSFAAGCNCNLDTLSAITRSGLTADGVSEKQWRRMPTLVKPLIVGSASKP